MDNVIIADRYGKELRTAIFTSYDIEVGDEDNTFEFLIKRQEYEQVTAYQRAYIPGTEYGGLVRRWETNTKQGTITIGGLTWRGMLKHKIISPPQGADYATSSGELNSIIRARIEEAFPFDQGNLSATKIIKGSSVDTGVTLPHVWMFERYCTLLDGLEKMLKSVNYKLDIQYDQEERMAVVSAVPIINYSQSVDFSSDMQVNYHVKQIQDGVNHLVCLGEGELKDRVVINLWLNSDGSIDGEYFFDVISGYENEIAEVYDYAGASREDLITSGVQRLRDIGELSTYEIEISGSLDIAIGDIVGGRDYLSGLYLTAPVAGKIIRWNKGFRTIEYRVSHNVYLAEADEPDMTFLSSGNLLKGGKEDVPPVDYLNKYIPDEVEAEPAEEVEEE